MSVSEDHENLNLEIMTRFHGKMEVAEVPVLALTQITLWFSKLANL